MSLSIVTLAVAAPPVLQMKLKPNQNFFQAMQREIPGAMEPPTLRSIAEQARRLIKPDLAKTIQEQGRVTRQVATLNAKKLAWHTVKILAGTAAGLILLFALGGFAAVPLVIKVAFFAASSFAVFKAHFKQSTLDKEMASAQAAISTAQERARTWQLLLSQTEDLTIFQSYLNNYQLDEGTTSLKRGQALLKKLEEMVKA